MLRIAAHLGLIVAVLVAGLAPTAFASQPTPLTPAEANNYAQQQANVPQQILQQGGGDDTAIMAGAVVIVVIVIVAAVCIYG